jgi:hypothetical protein
MVRLPPKPARMTYRQTLIGCLQASIVSAGWLIREILHPDHDGWGVWIALPWVVCVGLGFLRDRNAYARARADAR